MTGRIVDHDRLDVDRLSIEYVKEFAVASMLSGTMLGSSTSTAVLSTSTGTTQALRLGLARRSHVDGIRVVIRLIGPAELCRSSNY